MSLTAKPMSTFPGTNMLKYPFPLRPECMVRLVLPRDLTLAEVARLTDFMRALVLSIQGVTTPAAPTP